MKRDQFIGEIQERGHMASQLPPGGAELLRHERAGAGESFSLEEFFKRVNERRDPGVDKPRAVYHARVVIEVLQEAVTEGEVDDVCSQLPAEYAPLFEAGSQGEMDA